MRSLDHADRPPTARITTSARRGFDCVEMSRHNCIVRRLILLTLLVSALLWITAARTERDTSAVNAACAVRSPRADASQKPCDSDKQWHSPPRMITAITESFWKSMPAQAASAETHRARAFEITSASCSPGSTTRSAPLYLRHTPLLI